MQFENRESQIGTLHAYQMIMRISDEQNSKLIKSEGGVVGILDRLKSLLKWVISGPIIASVITKVNLDITNAKSHHENNQPFEQTFQKKVTDLVQEFLTQSNSFEERDDI